MQNYNNRSMVTIIVTEEQQPEYRNHTPDKNQYKDLNNKLGQISLIMHVYFLPVSPLAALSAARLALMPA
jgi:hypothetical protein